jgi:pseudaminic acid cytidylyltransferase
LNSCIAIITARGGSKRIPNKNIRDFLGKPIISYSIEAVIKSQLFNEVMVSTDSKKIADISIKFGAKVPFYRSKQNSDDFAITSDVIIEVIEEYNKIGYQFDYGCCIYPTAPFVTLDLLKRAFEKLKIENAYSLIPVVKYSYPIQRAFTIKDKKVLYYYPEFEYSRSQDLETAYYDAGQFYWFRIDKFMESKKLITDNTSYIEIPELNSQDIDNEEDWKLAEMKYKVLYKL